MKKHILLSVPFMGLIAVTALLSCQQNSPETPENLPPVLATTSESDITFPSRGGAGNITYTVENPEENAEVTLSVYNSDTWIHYDESASTEGIVAYTVNPNEGEARQTVLVLSYPGASPLTFNISQNAAGSDPEFVFNESTVQTFADGGAVELRYTIKNPVGSGDVTASVPEGTDWISGIDTETKNILRFTLSENTSGAERETILNLRHDIAEFSLTVIQSGEYKPTLQFQLDTVSVTSTSVTWNCIPSIKDQTYITMVVEKSYWDEFSSAEEYILDDIEYFRLVAEQYGMTLDEFLSGSQLQIGDLIGLTVDGQTPGTEYVIYAYGLTASAEITSDISYITYTTREQKDFGITFNADDYEVEMIVTPADGQRWYWFDLMPDEGLSGDELAREAQNRLNDLIDSYSWLFSIEECVMMYCHQGEDNEYYDNDGPGAYIGYAVYVDETTGKFSSELTTAPLTIGASSPAATGTKVMSRKY